MRPLLVVSTVPMPPLGRIGSRSLVDNRFRRSSASSPRTLSLPEFETSNIAAPVDNLDDRLTMETVLITPLPKHERRVTMDAARRC